MITNMQTPKGLPWWPSGYDSTLPIQGGQVRSLLRELDPTCCSKTWHDQINKYFSKKGFIIVNIYVELMIY